MKGARRSVRDRFEVARGVRREEGAIEGGLISGLDYTATLEIGTHGWRYTTTWLEERTRHRTAHMDEQGEQ